MNKEELLRLSALAKVTLEEGSEERLLSDLQDLITLVDSLSDLDTDSTLEESPSVTREDLPAHCLSREEALMNAPLQRDGYVVIP